MNGKGDAPRPLSVGLRELHARWEATFGPARPYLPAPIAEPDSPHRLVRHEPDPSGGRNSDT